jgi:small subunit ribosomal protein S7
VPRRREIKKRNIIADPKYRNVQLSKFVNVIMECGKKSVAEKIVYEALDFVKARLGKDPLEVFVSALDAIKPILELKSRRIGGANYQIPVEVIPDRQIALAMRWLRDFARKRSEKSMALRLAQELMDASEGRGGAIKRREEVHKMAEANKAFAHFRY